MIERVAIIIERIDVALGGAERSMLEVAQALSTLGLQVDLLAAKGTAAAENVRILCPDTHGKRVNLSVFACALRRHLSHTRYNVVHSVLPFAFADIYQPRGGAYAESILRNAASYPNPVVRGWKRVTALANFRRAGLLRAERRLCHGPSGPVIAALSRYVAEQLVRHYATDPRRIVLTPNGVDVDQHVDSSRANDSRRRILSQLGTRETDNPVLFLFAAHNFRLKGLYPLIQALQSASQTHTERPACLIVAGAGRSNRYRALARRVGVEERILFLGAVQHIRDILPVIDVGILPTFYDPSSRFILEALAAGKPVITTRFNGAIDHFTDGRHGKIVDSPTNVVALADAITHFTATANIDRASRAIREDDLRANISIRRVAGELLRLYEIILDSRKRP
jgi:UDP-glucose:(heptosyl)LPS alpha-1,3-glucosyltransferase